MLNLKIHLDQYVDTFDKSKDDDIESLGNASVASRFSIGRSDPKSQKRRSTNRKIKKKEEKGQMILMKK